MSYATRNKELRILHAQGVSVKDLAREYGLTQVYVKHIIKQSKLNIEKCWYCDGGIVRVTASGRRCFQCNIV